MMTVTGVMDWIFVRNVYEHSHGFSPVKEMLCYVECISYSLYLDKTPARKL